MFDGFWQTISRRSQWFECAGTSASNILKLLTLSVERLCANEICFGTEFRNSHSRISPFGCRVLSTGTSTSVTVVLHVYVSFSKTIIQTGNVLIRGGKLFFYISRVFSIFLELKRNSIVYCMKERDRRLLEKVTFLFSLNSHIGQFFWRQ